MSIKTSLEYSPAPHLVNNEGISYDNFSREEILKASKSLSNTSGRHAVITKVLGEYLSDFSLQKNRIQVMCLHLILFSELQNSPLKLSENEKSSLLNLASNFSEDDYVDIFEYDHQGRNGRKPLEHDLKAVELFLGEKLESLSMKEVIPFIHILCTSEDVNNLSYQMGLRDSLNEVILPKLRGIIQSLVVLVDKHKGDAILGRTHGQQAVPTTFGKLIATELENLAILLEPLQNLIFSGKFSGATGSNAAHNITFPNIDWIEYERKIVECFGFRQKECSDQRGPLVERVQLFEILKNVNNGIINLSGKLWDLCSRGVLIQKSIPGEAGSSVMPGKTNPWRLEEGKGAFKLSNGLFTTYTDNHLITDRERDLSEHPLERNYGEALGQMLIGLTNFIEQINRFDFSKENANAELDENPEVLGEAIQSVLRSKNIPHAYDFLALFMKGKNVTLEDIHSFISLLGTPIEKKSDIIRNSTENVRSMVEGLKGELKNNFFSIFIDSETLESLIVLDPKTYIGNCPTRAVNSSTKLISLMGSIDTQVTLCLNRPRILAVGWDFDDTLYLGDKKELKARIKYIVKEIGATFTKEQINNICSKARWDEQKKLLCEYLEENNINPDDGKIEELQEEAKPLFAHMLNMADGSMEALHLLKQKGLPSFLVTNRGPKSLANAFENYGLDPYFSYVANSNHKFKKPEKELMFDALTALGIPPSELVYYIGDTKIDISFAKNSGVTPIHINPRKRKFSGIETVPDMQSLFRSLSMKLL